MSRNRCTECGTSHPKWAGRCPSCGAWNTLVEEAAPRPIGARRGGGHRPPHHGDRGRRRPAGQHRPARAGPRARRRPGPGIGHGGRGRAGDREVDAPPAGRRGAGARRSTSALRLGRGERRAGAGPRRSTGRHGAGAVAAVGDARRRGRVRHRRAVARVRRGRLHPDLGRPGRRLLARGRSPRCGTPRTGWCRRRSSATSRWSSSATSRRTARWPARGCWSTSWTPCSRSRGTATMRSGCCGR